MHLKISLFERNANRIVSISSIFFTFSCGVGNQSIKRRTRIRFLRIVFQISSRWQFCRTQFCLQTAANRAAYLPRSSSLSDSQARSSRREVIKDPVSYDVIYSRSPARTGSYGRATLACRSLLIANRFIGRGILLEFNTILRCSTANDHSQGRDQLFAFSPSLAPESFCFLHRTRYNTRIFTFIFITLHRLTSFCFFFLFSFSSLESKEKNTFLTIKDSFL